MHWGLIPHWADDPSIGNRMINARAETLTELPSFKSLVTRFRCIIPADGFYEWRKVGKRKVPMWVHLNSREPFGLAGPGNMEGELPIAVRQVHRTSPGNERGSVTRFVKKSYGRGRLVRARIFRYFPLLCQALDNVRPTVRGSRDTFT
jgi:SOS response associated peptidase (SRAP)